MAMQLSAIMNLTGNFVAQIQKNAEAMQGIAQQAKQVGDSLKNAFPDNIGQKFASGLSVARDAFGAAGLASAGFLKTCVDGAAKAQKTNADLAQTIKSTGGAAGLTAEEVSKMASEFSKSTTFGAGAIKTGQNMLLTFTNIGKDVFPQATQAMLDMAQKMGGDPVNSSIQLGKALNDPTSGLTALTRVGITFTEQQKNQIKTMQAAGDVAGAQKIILGELNKEFGGQAAAALQTYDGQMKLLSNTFGSIKSTIGSVLLPYLQAAAEKINTGAQAVSKFVTEHKTLVAAVLSITAVFGTLIGGVGLFTKLIGFLGPTVTSIAGLIGGLSAPILIVIGAIAALVYAYTQNFGGMKDFISGVIGGVVSAFKMASEQFKNTGDAISAIGVFVKNIFGDDVGNKVTSVLTNIGAIVMSFINTVKEHMPQIKAAFQSAFDSIVNIWNSILKPVLIVIMQVIGTVISWVVNNWPQISKVIMTVFTAIKGVWDSVLKPVLNFMIETIGKVVQWVVANWPLIKKTIETVLNGIMSVVTSVLNAIQSFWNTWGDTIMSVASSIWDGIKTVIETVIHVIEDVIKAVMQAINGDWSGAWTSLCDAVGTIFNGAIKIIGDVLDSIGAVFKGIAVTAIGWGKDMIQGIIDGIKGAIGGVEEAVSSVADKIRSFLHFSVPDVGPLTDYETWMPDFMKGMGDGIKVNTHLVTDPIKDLSVGIKTNTLSSLSIKDRSVSNLVSNPVIAKDGGGITIAKLADQIIIREEADIDKIANAFVRKLQIESFKLA